MQPRRIIEVGAGVSTACILNAVARNQASGATSCEVISIEPHPRPWLRSAAIELLERPVQEVGVELFDSLGARDLLFIDSSHAVKVASDVNFLMLEVVPGLAAGVIVHFHDIYLPYDFPRDALCTLSQPQETSLLHALLIGNHAVRILFSLSMLHYERRDLLRQVFPEYAAQRESGGLQDPSYRPFEEITGHFPSSTYLEILGPAQQATAG
ncbi:MAG: class I SAM-dependent methyltransferase [Candidatus Binataceae bacterium]